MTYIHIRPSIQLELYTHTLVVQFKGYDRMYDIPNTELNITVHVDRKPDPDPKKYHIVREVGHAVSETGRLCLHVDLIDANGNRISNPDIQVGMKFTLVTTYDANCFSSPGATYICDIITKDFTLYAVKTPFDVTVNGKILDPQRQYKLLIAKKSWIFILMMIFV